MKKENEAEEDHECEFHGSRFLCLFMISVRKHISKTAVSKCHLLGKRQINLTIVDEFLFGSYQRWIEKLVDPLTSMKDERCLIDTL